MGITHAMNSSQFLRDLDWSERLDELGTYTHKKRDNLIDMGLLMSHLQAYRDEV